MNKSAISATIAMTALTVLMPLSALAQACNLGGTSIMSLRDPYIEGETVTPPAAAAPQGQPPPIGNGPNPVPVTGGMGGGPTLLPQNPINPANNIEYPSYVIPFNPATQSPPGVLGPSTWAPPAPSTLGADPGIIHRPLDYVRPPVSVVPINPGGGIYGGAPMNRWGGQTTADFGRRKTRGRGVYESGAEAIGSTSQDGPWQTLPGATVVQDLYGNRMPWRNNGDPTIQTIAPY